MDTIFILYYRVIIIIDLELLRIIIYIVNFFLLHDVHWIMCCIIYVTKIAE